MKIDFRSVLPYILIIAGFVLLSAVYFFPALQGYSLEQQDIQTYRGMSKEIHDHRDIYEDEPLWTNALFGGMPAYQISVQYPGEILNVIDDAIHLWLPRPVRFLFLYMIGFFILLRALRVNIWLSAIGAVAFAFSSYYLIIIEAGHNTKAHAIGYMAPALAGIILTYRGRLWLGGSLTGLFLALQLQANHVQITYYFGILVVLYAIAVLIERVREKQLMSFVKSSAILLGAAALALVCNANNLWNTYQYGKHTTRGQTELSINPDGSSNEGNRTDGLDRDYITRWSYGKGETWSLLIPDAKGGASEMIGKDASALTGISPQFRQQIMQSSRYWGDQPGTSGPVYVGAVIVLLFLLGAFYVKGPVKWALVATAILTILLAWGKNLMGLTDFFLDNVPLYDKFRAVTIILSVTELVFPLLGMIFLHKLWKDPGLLSRNMKPFLYVSGGLLAILALFYITPDSFFSFISEREQTAFQSRLGSGGQQARMISQYLDNLEEVRMYIFKSDVIRSFVFILLSGVLIYFFAKKTINRTVLGTGLFVLILIDLWAVDKRYINNEKERGEYVQWETEERDALAYPVQEVDKAILDRELQRNPSLQDSLSNYVTQFRKAYQEAHGGKAKPGEDLLEAMRLSALRLNSHYRVLTLNNPFNDASISYYHKSVGGYHGAKLQRYQDLISFHISDEMSQLSNALQGQSQPSDIRAMFDGFGVLNMLNTRYIIYNPQAGPIMNPAAYGNAWFVDDLQWVAGADEEITKLGEINPSQTAVADEKFREKLGDWTPASANADIYLESYKPNHLVYRSSSSSANLAVFSEIYYPDGWKAYIDGEPAEHIRVNYVLRALAIPEGDHVIEFKFEPESYTQASTASTVASIILLLLVIFGFVKEARKPKPEEVSNES